MSDTVKINYAGNSQKAKAEQQAKPEPSSKNLEKIEGVSAVARKKPLGRKIAETFTGDDAQTVGNYLLIDVLVPAVKNLLFDVISEGSNRMLFGAGGGRSRGSNVTRSGHIAYNRVSTNGARANAEVAGPKTMSNRARATHDFDEIIFETRGQAESALETLRNALEEYKNVTVSDLYELAEITSSFQDHSWGWLTGELNDARVKPVRQGFLLELPAPRSIS